jgi:hypothetical protein
MQRIEPLRDHQELERLRRGDVIVFKGDRHKVFSRTTLASGEPGLILQHGNRQFLVSYTELRKAWATHQEIIPGP